MITPFQFPVFYVYSAFAGKSETCRTSGGAAATTLS